MSFDTIARRKFDTFEDINRFMRKTKSYDCSKCNCMNRKNDINCELGLGCYFIQRLAMPLDTIPKIRYKDYDATTKISSINGAKSYVPSGSQALAAFSSVYDLKNVDSATIPNSLTILYTVTFDPAIDNKTMIHGIGRFSWADRQEFSEPLPLLKEDLKQLGDIIEILLCRPVAFEKLDTIWTECYM